MSETSEIDREKMWDDIIGLYAYDTGSRDFGIHDNVLKSECFVFLHSLDVEDKWLERKVRDKFLSEEALALRYGLEDVRAFFEWLRDNGYDI